MKNIRLLVSRIMVLASIVTFLTGAGTLLAQDTPDKTSDPVYELGSGVIAPKGVYMPNPEYTDKARKKKINGTVLLAIIVTAEGKVRDVKVTKSLDEGLDKQAIAAVRTWKFEPGTKDGQPVAVHLNTEVTFSLY